MYFQNSKKLLLNLNMQFIIFVLTVFHSNLLYSHYCRRNKLIMFFCKMSHNPRQQSDKATNGTLYGPIAAFLDATVHASGRDSSPAWACAMVSRTRVQGARYPHW
jgi:hypothetical protein